MERVIKFRGWHTEAKRMFSAEEMAGDQLTILPTGSFINVNGTSTRLSTIYPRDKFIPLQFTGLLDKNGVEIYEHDIINVEQCELVDYTETDQGTIEKYEDSKGKVHYVPTSFCFDGHSAGDLPLESFDSYKIEVIGNIYQHLELLNQTKP